MNSFHHNYWLPGDVFPPGAFSRLQENSPCKVARQRPVRSMLIVDSQRLSFGVLRLGDFASTLFSSV